MAYYTKNTDPVHKVTIVPRGQALVITAQLPVEDKYNYSKQYLKKTDDFIDEFRRKYYNSRNIMLYQTRSAWGFV